MCVFPLFAPPRSPSLAVRRFSWALSWLCLSVRVSLLAALLGRLCWLHFSSLEIGLSVASLVGSLGRTSLIYLMSLTMLPRRESHGPSYLCVRKKLLTAWTGVSCGTLCPRWVLVPLSSAASIFFIGARRVQLMLMVTFLSIILC